MFCWKGKFTSKFCIISDSQEKGGLRLKGFESRRQLVAPVTLRGLREVPGGDGHGVRLVGGGAPPWFLTLCPGWNPAQWWCGWDESWRISALKANSSYFLCHNIMMTKTITVSQALGLGFHVSQVSTFFKHQPSHRTLIRFLSIPLYPCVINSLFHWKEFMKKEIFNSK